MSNEVKADEHNINEYMEQRINHREELEELGIHPYGMKYERSHSIDQVIEAHKELEESEEGETVQIAGRLMALREHGKVTFGNIVDVTGNIQIYLKKNVVGEENYQLLKKIDIGDILGAKGKIFKTRRGELTVFVEEFTILAKALRQPPEKYHGIKDVELRYRQRYVDLLSNPQVRDDFIKRSRIISVIRRQLEDKGFIEVETPSMSSLAGGASARPFTTFHNALEMELYFRIATELYLKRCIVGGLEKVFEIGRIFRNEGIDTRHNPEFTMLELYQAYADYTDMMQITEDIISNCCKEVNGSYKVELDGNTINLEPPYERITMKDAFKKYADINFDELRNISKAKEIAKKYNLELEREEDLAYLMDKIFGAAVEPYLIQPMFILDYPIEMSPLAKRKNDDPSLTYRFELFVNSSEIANAFSELNDPVDQRKRFEMQIENKEKFKDDEAHPMDEDYIEALEYGMPPTGGLGIGIDRLAMLILGKTSIRDVILFPLLKKKSEI
ncbi:MAG: lysine--tRNA ligase [Vulcanimicrobiota bacterium]